MHQDLQIKKIITSLVTLFLMAIFGLAIKTSVLATELSISTGSDWQNGTLDGVESTSTEGEIKLTPQGTWGAQSWKTPDKTIGVGSAFASDGEHIYVFRGYGDVAFWRYTPSSDTWETLTNAPRGVYYGADLQYHNGSIYALFGGYQKAFARYSITNNTWEMMPDFPNFVWQGGSLTSDGTYIYGSPGNSPSSAGEEFYRYDPATGNWQSKAKVPLTLGAGADLTHINGYIYTPRGINTTSFYRYSIADNTWTTMAAVPATLNDDLDITADGTNLFVSRQLNTTSFYRYNVATNTWTTLTNAPANSRYAGVQYLESDGLFYFFQGNGQYRFWKYDSALNSFLGPADAPATLGSGSNMIYYNSEFYVPRGTNTTTFYKYSPSSNTWSTLTSSDVTFNDDTKGVLAGSKLYFFRGSNTNTFVSYDIPGNFWTTLTTSPTATGFGASLYYPGSGDYIYATRGQNTGTFWRYTISTNSWEVSSGGLPIANLPAEVIVGFGSQLVGSGNEIYLNSGTGTKRFFKYSISGNTWTELTDLPFSPYWGTNLTYANGVITATAGYYQDDVYEYNPTANSWRKLASLPAYGPTDLGVYNGSSLAFNLDTNSFLLSRGGNKPEILAYSPDSQNYPASGTWTSEAKDFQHVEAWNSLIVSAVTPSDSDIQVSTRSSSDGSIWSSWQEVSGSNIISPTNRYLQIKATLNSSSDFSETPRLQSIAVDYDSDSTPPVNPVSYQAFSSQVGGVELVSESSYRHLNPYFTWADAVDDQTSIDGYYVYFGSNPTAEPKTDGVFQTETSYQSLTELETGTYYLRIVSKNSVGLTSVATTGFIYDYIGVSPSQDLMVSQSIDFSGITTQTTTSSDQIRLDSLSEGFWTNERLALVSTTIQYGGSNAAYIEAENKIYVVPGANNTNFGAYDLSTNAWKTLTATPANTYYGGGVVEGPPGYLYCLRGTLTTDFWKYDIDNGWESVTSAPLTIGYGASMVYDGNQFIYITRGNNTNTFWRYDTTTDEWNTLDGVEFGAPSSNINNLIYQSADLAIDRDNQLIYATQGNFRQGFAVYDINTSQWTVLPDTPALTHDGSALEFDATNNRVYYSAGGGNTDLFYYDVVSQTWTKVSNAPSGLSYGAGLTRVGDDLYVIRGGNSTSFYKYNITNDTWLLPNRGLFSRVFDGYVGAQGVTNTGADIVKGDGHNYYLTRGNYADDFVRWNEETGEVTQLANTPSGVYTGSSMVYDPNANQIYFTAGTIDRSFFNYNIATNVWTKIATDPIPIIANAGSSMVYDGSRYIYLNRGGYTNTFYRYDQQATAGSRWSTLATLPLGVSNGAELLLKEGYIYTLRGGSNTVNSIFYRYQISNNTWTSLAPMIAPVNTDGYLLDGNDGYFYLGRGINTSDFFRYSVSGDSWEQLDAMPAQVTTGGAAESNLLNKIYMMPGPGTDTYGDALYTYVLNTANSGFVESGNYISQSHDLTSVYKWANLEVTQTVPSNTELIIETRTSADNSTWSDWVATSQPKPVGTINRYKINSPTARYIQVKFTLNSPDKISTPIVEDYNINYYQDTLPPTNPLTDGFTAYSDASHSATLSNLPSVWHNATKPQFEWAAAELTNGASDTATGSGVLGYYVYFGIDEAGDPEDDGQFQATNSYTPSTLTNNSEHYLRVQTVDEAGNVNPEIWQPFVYRYDAEGPTVPTNLTANPSGYSSNPNFSFSWEVASASGALVSDYCYKTATTSGTFANDQCTTELSVSDVPAYKVGTNTFSVRAKDQAGNFSDYANVSYFYADVNNAPAPPSNLQVNPTSSAENSFAFSWSIPDAFLGSASNLSYRYSINALPTAQSTSETSLTYLNAGAYATLPGENTFYVVAKDEAGNINYSNYASVVFTANTVAPGIPINMEIADVSVKAKQSWRLAISWDEPEDAGSGVASYKVYRSLDGVEFTSLATTSGTSYVDTKLDQVTYYYQITACDNTNNCGAESTSVSLLPTGKYTEPAELVSGPNVSAITTKKATISWGTARTADSRIAYGTSSGDYFETEVSSSEQIANHILTLPNLTPGTTYYYVARWTDEDGNTGESEEATFSTQPPPTTQEPIAKSLGLTSALIEFTTKNAEKVKLYYGETPSYGGVKELSTGTAEGTYTIELDELKDGTKYYYKINTFDIDDTEYEGEMHSFTTLPRPKVGDISITQVQGAAQTTLLIRWKSNTAISSIVTYFPTAAPQKAKDEVNIALKAGDHRMILLNLEPNTPYSLIIRGKDAAGNEARSEIQQLTTSADTRPPQILDLKVESEIIGVGEEATVQLLVSYKTDEAATSQIEYGEGTSTTYSQKTQEDATRLLQHLVVISGLSPGKVYHLRALATDENKNQGLSIDKVIVTPKATDSALDLVITNLTSVFSFLGTSQ